MKNKLLKNIFGNLLIKGSLIILLSSLVSNIGSYLYHLVMGRMLGPSEYGVLESLFSFLYFLGIPVGVLNLIVIKFVSVNKGNKKTTSDFIGWMILFLLKYGLILSIVFILLFPFLNNIVKVNTRLPFIIIGATFFIGNFQSVMIAVFQGILQFIKVGVLGIVLSWFKLALSILFVILGLKTSGALGGILFSSIITFYLSLLMLKKYLVVKIDKNKSKINYFKGYGRYSLGVLFSNLSITSLYSTDIILARYFLTPTDAGYYAALSVLGKIIFFASSPITTVMFPIISGKRAKSEAYQKTLYLSLLLVAMTSLIITLIYLFFPSQMVNLLFGKLYNDASKYLFYFGIFIALFSISNLMMNFFLSISVIKPVILSVLAAIIQILLICIFHNSITIILKINIIITLLLASGLIVYYLKYEKSNSSFGNRSCL